MQENCDEEINGLKQEKKKNLQKVIVLEEVENKNEIERLREWKTILEDTEENDEH